MKRFVVIALTLPLLGASGDAPPAEIRYDFDSPGDQAKAWSEVKFGTDGRIVRKEDQKSDGTFDGYFCVIRTSPFGTTYMVTVLRNLRGRYEISGMVRTSGVGHNHSLGYPGGQFQAVPMRGNKELDYYKTGNDGFEGDVEWQRTSVETPTFDDPSVRLKVRFGIESAKGEMCIDDVTIKPIDD